MWPARNANTGKRKEANVKVSHEPKDCSAFDILFQLTTFSSQIWEETFQRVTNEQEIYEGLFSNFKMYCLTFIYSHALVLKD